MRRGPQPNFVRDRHDNTVSGLRTQKHYQILAGHVANGVDGNYIRRNPRIVELACRAIERLYFDEARRTEFMGDIRSNLREITKQEIDAIARRSEWYGIETADSADVRLLEFDLGLDSVVSYPAGSLPKDIHLHVLNVGSIRIGFEISFMQWAFVTGSFPTDRLRVGFAVRPSSEQAKKWEDASGANWAVSFCWEGNPLRAEEMPQDSWPDQIDDILPVYRLWAIQQAESML